VLYLLARLVIPTPAHDLREVPLSVPQANLRVVGPCRFGRELSLSQSYCHKVVS